ncbi:MAG: molybdenum cofactor guanylyltransferase [Pseudomonadota bacterium]
MSSLCGLILAGGQSRRMGQDKALLVADGQSLLARSASLLDQVDVPVSVSVRERAASGERARWPQIVDAHGHQGPADGILSAMASEPDSAWLVLACDLPRLDVETLRELIKHRDRDAMATAMRSRHNALPEPLCAIYEPSARAPMQRMLDTGIRCPRKMLLSIDTRLLPPADRDALANANTPEDWNAIGAAL